MIGVFSPVTMVIYICLIAVGLVLFERKIVYAMLVPATCFLTFSGYLSFIDVIPYAPIFGGVSKSMLKKSRLNFDKIEKCK